MDAVKFFKEYRRMCKKHRCEDCPMRGNVFCFDGCYDLSQEESERVVGIVEKWSKENPEEIGKKYIIEIDKVECDDGHKLYHIKDGLWLNEGTIAKLEEYKESEDKE